MRRSSNKSTVRAYPGAKQFVLRHGTLLAIFVAASVATDGAVAFLVMLELSAWLMFLLATPRGFAFRLTCFLFSLTASCMGLLAVAHDNAESFRFLCKPQLLIITISTAIAVLFLMRQSVFVFKRLRNRNRLRTRLRVHYSVSDIMLWTIAIAGLCAATGLTAPIDNWIVALAISCGHGIVIATSVAFSTWFWLFAGPVTRRFDVAIISLVIALPVVILTAGSIIGWIAGLAVLCFPYTVYLIWIGNVARRQHIRVGQSNQEYVGAKRQLPKRIEVVLPAQSSRSEPILNVSGSSETD